MTTPSGPQVAIPVLPPGVEGLSEDEAGRRLAARGPVRRLPTSRSYASIVRANVLTVFNGILAGFGALTLAFGDWRDALFLGILVANTTIGVAQEIRAKRALDRLSALVAPTAAVVRSGVPRRVPVGEVVPDDLVALTAGDQVVADGTLVASEALRLDESILTGESAPAARRQGEEVRSGSFAVEGLGAYLVTAVGRESYAERLASVARGFRHPRSPLEVALDRLLVWLAVVTVPIGVALGLSLWVRDVPVGDAVPTAVAGIVNLIPEGLILLTSLTFAVSALRMASRGALAQQLNAVESLASVDTMCIDKTGTLTEAGLRLVKVTPAGDVGEAELRAELGRYAAAAPTRNATVAAIAAACPDSGGPTAEATLPFSSRWRFSGVRLGGRWLLLGAPEILVPAPLVAEARREAAAGRRVVALVSSRESPGEAGGTPTLPERLEPLGLVVLAERLRADAREAVECLRREDVELLVLSGDAPETVAAIAADAGIAEARGLDGRGLPPGAGELLAAVTAARVVGRVSPEDKHRVVSALRESGRYVAMLGDGVNDVPALKEARLAIAQASGSQMARSIADVVLVSGGFASVPPMVAEGQKILRNLQRVAKLFVSKAVFAGFVVLTVGLAPVEYPFLPRHLTLVTTLTIGVPGFFLALAPSSGPWRPERFLGEVVGFSLRAGLAIGAAVVGSYLLARKVLELPLLEARTVASTVMLVLGLYLILALEGVGIRRTAAVTSLCAVLTAVYLVVLLIPFTREFFQLDLPGPKGVPVIVGGAGFGLVLLWALGIRPGDRRSGGTARRP